MSGNLASGIRGSGLRHPGIWLQASWDLASASRDQASGIQGSGLRHPGIRPQASRHMASGVLGSGFSIQGSGFRHPGTWPQASRDQALGVLGSGLRHPGILPQVFWDLVRDPRIWLQVFRDLASLRLPAADQYHLDVWSLSLRWVVSGRKITPFSSIFSLYGEAVSLRFSQKTSPETEGRLGRALLVPASFPPGLTPLFSPSHVPGTGLSCRADREACGSGSVCWGARPRHTALCRASGMWPP